MAMLGHAISCWGLNTDTERDLEKPACFYSVCTCTLPLIYEQYAISKQ